MSTTNTSDDATYFPAALKLRGRKVVVLGGGGEATRKVLAILPCRPKLTVISPEPGPTIAQLAEAGRLTLAARPYRHGDLEGALLAIVCEPAAGAAVRTEATERGVLLNVLDQPDLCDVIAMATFSRDGLQVGVHSSGKSAALSRRICEKLESQFGEAYAELARLLGRLRPIVHRTIPTADARRTFWLGLVNAELLDRVATGFLPRDLEKQILARASAHGRDHVVETRVNEGG